MERHELMGNDGSACGWIDPANGSMPVYRSIRPLDLSAKKVSIDVKEGVKRNKPFLEIYSSLVYWLKC